MNQPSSSLSLDLDTCSNSSDSLSECETLTVPDPNDPVTIRKFVDETVIGPISLQDQNIDQINAINSELHIGTVHKNIFHFHGNVKPPSKINGETQQNGGDEPHHLSGKTWRWRTKYLPFVIGCSLVVVISILLLAISTSPPRRKTWKAGESCRNLTPIDTCNEGIINRSCWNAGESSRNLTPFNFELQYFKIFVTHTKKENCKCYWECLREVKRLQTADMRSGLPDIRYNYLVGGTDIDVYVYEGQGLKYSSPNNSKTIQIALMGNFDRKSPLSKMCEKVKDFIENTIQDHNLRFCNFQIDDGLKTTGCLMKPILCIQKPEET